MINNLTKATYLKSSRVEVGSRWWGSKILSSPLPMDTSLQIIPSERDLKN